MSAEKNALERLVDDIQATREDEIQCEDAGTVMARCADAHLSDEETQRQYPTLWHHFRFCPDCFEEYRLTMELTRLEAESRLEQPASLPPLPDEGHPAVWAWAADTISTIFPGFPPALAGALTRGVDLAVEPVEIELAKGDVRIAFDVAINDRNTDLRDLFCTVSATGESQRAAFEGAPVWLQVGDEGAAILEEALDELGDVAFSGLPPARYALRLHLAGQEYVVTGIVLL